jgi:hypothetical protein
VAGLGEARRRGPAFQGKVSFQEYDMALVHIAVSIEGSTPLLCNRFGDAAAMDASSGTRPSGLRDKGTPLEQAEAKLYLGHDGQPMIPVPNLFRCLIDAGTYFKAGKSKITTQKSSLIPACVEVLGVAIPIVHREPWTVDTRPVRIPSTGGRILCHRPCFHDWKLAFEVSLDTDMISLKLFREIVDAAGKRIGLGDFRPSCKGPFGRFYVTLWTPDEPERRDGRARRVAVPAE